MPLSRRNFLRGALFGGTALGLTSLGLGPALTGRMTMTKGGLLVPTRALGTYEMLTEALRQGSRISLGGTPAYADPPRTIKIVHVKVMNEIHTKLIFRPGALTGANDGTVTITERAIDSKAPTAGTALDAMGILKVSTEARRQNLRLNQWFGGILFDGFEGGDATKVPASVKDYVRPFTDQVAIKAVVGINANNGHVPKNMCYPDTLAQLGTGGDFLFDLMQSGMIAPPLGLTAFNMGVTTQTTEGDRRASVLGSDGTTVVADGKSVTEMTQVLSSVISAGLVKDDVVTKFDALGAPTATLRQAMMAARTRLLDVKAKLDGAATASTQDQTQGPGNRQQVAPETDGPATSEFLAQCRWVRDALSIDRTSYPFSAFSLDLNVADLNGQPFDVGKGAGQTTRGLSYVEGMRQLAFGLNVLAQAIAENDDLYVLVTSEGGRDELANDNAAPCALILGPSKLKDPTYGLEDKLFAHSDFMKASGFATDPNAISMPLDGGGLATFGGTANSSEAVVNSDVLHGLRAHLEQIVAPKKPRIAAYGNRLLVSS